MKQIKPIETVYNGYRFRSRLEARWAVFFDEAGIRYEYEPEGFEAVEQKYLPDFYLPNLKTYVEIKHNNAFTIKINDDDSYELVANDDQSGRWIQNNHKVIQRIAEEYQYVILLGDPYDVFGGNGLSFSHDASHAIMYFPTICGGKVLCEDEPELTGDCGTKCKDCERDDFPVACSACFALYPKRILQFGNFPDGLFPLNADCFEAVYVRDGKLECTDMNYIDYKNAVCEVICKAAMKARQASFEYGKSGE